MELKQAIAYSFQAGRKMPDLVGKILREIAAFPNTGNGNVIIGIVDATGEIIGIADDIKHADPSKPTRDGYELFLRNSI